MMSSAFTTKRKFVVNIEPKRSNSELSVIDAIHVPSEVIAKIFVEKIITNTVRIVNNIECDNRIGDHCFKFLENNISPILALSFPLYEKDDTEHCCNKDTIFYSEKFENENTWEEIKEPSPLNVDRNSCSFVKSELVISYVPAVRPNDIVTIKEKKFHNYTGSSTTIVPKDGDETDKKKLKKMPTIELPAYDISIEDDERKEVDDVERLRREREMIIAKRNKEKREQTQKEIEEKKSEKVDTKPKKNFDFDKFGFDPLGNVYQKKAFVQKMQLSHEFYITKTKIDKPKPRNSVNRRSIFRNSIKHRTKRTIMPEDIIQNPYLNNGMVKKDLEQLNVDKIPPAGSNFDIIYPNVGVRITENKRMKGGDKDFATYFKKTSTDEYNKILNEFIPNLNKTIMHTKVGRLSISHQDTNNEVITNANTNEDNPLLISNINEGIAMTEGNINSNRNILSSSLFPSHRKNLSFMNSSVGLSSMNNSIKLKSSMVSSLKMAIDSIKSISRYDDNVLMTLPAERPIKIINTKYKLSLNKRENNVTAINNFNKEILKNKNWGKEMSNREKRPNDYFTHHKPSNSSCLKELGMSIMNTRPPRSRKNNHLNLYDKTSVSLFKM